MNANPLQISVVCPVYNTQPDLLRAAVHSVIETAGPHLLELLLVDDASTRRETLIAIDELVTADARVVVIRQPHNAGHCAARNRGIRQARGDWLGFVDHDDLWLPGRIEAVLPVMKEFPDAGWIAGNFQGLWRDGTLDEAAILSHSCAGTRLYNNLVRLESPYLTRYLIGNSWLHMGASLIKRKYVQKIDGLYEGFFYYHEDAIFFTRLSVMVPCFFIERTFYTWRRHNSSLMASPRRLTSAYAAGWRRARRDRLLRRFRREIRWTLYGTHKGLAINNLRNARPWTALGFALRAWLMDPREVSQLALFLAIMFQQNSPDRSAQELRYSRSERFFLEPV